MTRVRKFWVKALLGALLAALLCIGGVGWRRHRFDRRVMEAVASLAQGGDAWISDELIAGIVDNPRYEAEFRLFRGAWLLRSGEPAAVFPAIAGLRPEGRVREPLLLIVGETYYRTAQIPRAEEVFLQLVQSNPRNSRAHRWLATIHHDLGNIVATYSELEKVAELEPDDFYAYRLMGMLNLLDYQQPKEAADCYRKALERHPPPSVVQELRIELAQSLAGLNDFAGAIEILEAAQVDARVLAEQAGCRWGLGDKDEAVVLLNKAIAADPRQRKALLLKARFALEDGKPQIAVEQLQAVLESDPHDFNSRYQLSMAYRRMGDKVAAAAELERSNASKALRARLNELYAQAMQRSRDADVRKELADLCDQLQKHELAELWRRSAEFCRQEDWTTLFPR